MECSSSRSNFTVERKTFSLFVAVEDLLYRLDVATGGGSSRHKTSSFFTRLSSVSFSIRLTRSTELGLDILHSIVSVSSSIRLTRSTELGLDIYFTSAAVYKSLSTAVSEAKSLN